MKLSRHRIILLRVTYQLIRDCYLSSELFTLSVLQDASGVF